ncbi:MAG: sensor histidine kinase, partial [Ruminococcus sp.]|nr:sensor histidine kinase [Ruminococcus sp.]
MNKTGIVIILLCSLAAAAVVLWERRKVRKTMEEIERMLDAAMTGSFSEITFDESQLSALETKFAHYLSAAEASSRNMAQEKDKIKSLIADIS